MGEEVLRRKLEADGEVNGDDRRLGVLYRTVLALARRADGELSDDARQQWLQDWGAKVETLVEQTEQSGAKALAVGSMGRAEAGHYAAQAEDIGERRRQAQSRILASAQALEDAKQIRKHREEYELMATKIREFPARAETEARLGQLSAQLHGAQGRLAGLHEQMELRQKQFSALVSCLSELTQALPDSIDQPQDQETASQVTNG